MLQHLRANLVCHSVNWDAVSFLNITEYPGCGCPGVILQVLGWLSSLDGSCLDAMCPGEIYMVEIPGCDVPRYDICGWEAWMWCAQVRDVPRWDMCGWEASMLCAQEWRSKWKTMLSVTYRLNEKEKMGGSVFHMLYIFLLSGRNYCTYMLYVFGFEERLYI